MGEALTEEEKELLQFHLEHLNIFLKEFFHAGNWDFNLNIHSHDCASGLWYSAEWKDKEGRARRASSMYGKLCWERVIKVYLVSQRKPSSEEPPSDV